MAFFSGDKYGRRILGGGPPGISAEGLSLSGDKALQEFLKTLPPVVIKGALRESSKKAYRPIVAAAKANARAWGAKARDTRDEPWPTRWREVAKSIVLKQKTYAIKGIVYTHVGVNMNEYPNRGRGTNPVFVPGYLAYILEYGTGAHMRKTAGPHPGASPRPFLRPAFDNNVSMARSVMSSDLRPALERAAEKEARRVAKKYPGGRP